MCDYFGENGPKCEKRCKANIIHPWNNAVFFKDVKLKDK